MTCDACIFRCIGSGCECDCHTEIDRAIEILVERIDELRAERDELRDARGAAEHELDEMREINRRNELRLEKLREKVERYERPSRTAVYSPPRKDAK